MKRIIIKLTIKTIRSLYNQLCKQIETQLAKLAADSEKEEEVKAVIKQYTTAHTKLSKVIDYILQQLDEQL